MVLIYEIPEALQRLCEGKYSRRHSVGREDKGRDGEGRVIWFMGLVKAGTRHICSYQGTNDISSVRDDDT